MIYFLYESYKPNTASTNRALAYIRNLEKLKMPIKVFFFLPDEKKSKIEGKFRYVDIQYCWDKFYLNHRILKYISYIYYVKLILRQLRYGDKVYIYGLNDIKGRFIYKKGIDVYYEETENPEVSLPGSWLKHVSLDEHIEQCRHLKGLIVISYALKEYFIEKGVSADKIHVVNMTVDTSRFDGLEKEESVESYIAYCGTASNNKDGVDKLIRAFAIFHKKYPDIKLYIIGRTPAKDDKSGNLELIHSLGIEEHVIFTGVINSDDMPQILKNAAMLALARPNNMQAKYGFPTKLGEYLLTANPVVVTKVGEIPLFLKDGESALVAEADSTEEFAEKMKWVIAHPQEAVRIGERGKEVAQTFFNAYTETLKLMSAINN